MIAKVARIAAILGLPLAGLAALWAQSETLSHQGTDWEVPVQGYDPRDLLRGHYVEFRYDWPVREQEGEDEDIFIAPQYSHLCLIGAPPIIAEAIPFDDPSDPMFEQCEHKLSVQPGSVYGYRSLTRGRLYVGQDRALELEKGLRERSQRGIVTFRQRDDGVLTVQSIRFRPLTAEEEADRDRPRRGTVVDVESAPVVETSEPRETTSD